MKTSYTTAAIAKQVATKQSKKTGKAFVAVGPVDGAYTVKEVEFFPAVKLIDAQPAAKKAPKKAAKKAQAVSPAVPAEVVAAEVAATLSGGVSGLEAEVIETTPTVEAVAPAPKKAATPTGLRPAAWKFIKQNLPEVIEEVHVRHGNGKRYLLTVNGATVWYAFEEQTAKIAKDAVLALKAA